jgi:urate oxidase
MKGDTMKNHEKDFDILRDKIDKLVENTDTKMNTLIDDYNTKYEDDDDSAHVETCDLSSLFSQLSDFCEDHI